MKCLLKLSVPSSIISCSDWKILEYVELQPNLPVAYKKSVHPARQWLWWSSYSYAINEPNSINKPSSNPNLLKKKYRQKYLSVSLHNEQKTKRLNTVFSGKKLHTKRKKGFITLAQPIILVDRLCYSVGLSTHQFCMKFLHLSQKVYHTIEKKH